MAWVRIDDHYDEHPKFAKAGPLGMALWLAGLAYCNRNLTDGFIPWAKARGLLSWDFLGPETNSEGQHKVYTVAVTSGMAGDDVECAFVIEQLLFAGLWDEVEGGYQVHDYLDYQPSKDDVQRERQRHAERQARYRASAPGSDSVGDGVTDGATDSVSDNGPVPNPVPVPKPKTKISKPNNPPLSPQGGRRRVTEVDELFRECMVTEYAPLYGSVVAVRSEIDDAMGHANASKHHDQRAYVRNWLRRGVPRGAKLRPIVVESPIESAPHVCTEACVGKLHWRKAQGEQVG